MKTLLIIDAQNDFMPGGSLEVENGDEIVPLINKISQNFDLVVATQDWHPSHHSSFASNHSGEEPFTQIKWKGLDQTLWPDHCVQGSHGAAFHKDLKTHKIEAIFRKGMDADIDSYSGFFDNDHQKSTGLSGYLKEKNASDLYICGLAADICVYFTLKDAIDLNFNVHLIEDGTRPLERDEFEQQKKQLKQKGLKIIHSGELS